MTQPTETIADLATREGGLMSTHTPGPWKVDGMSIISEQYCIAVIEDDGGYEAPERKENARLISAAPDLLAACENGRRILAVAVRCGLSGFSEKETDEIVNNHSTIKMMDAAIAKAENAA